MVDDPKMWSSERRCRQLSHHFGRHILPLLVVYKADGKAHVHLFSGILVHAINRLMWITAGHVVDDLKKIASLCDVKVCHWSDSYPKSDAQSIPADLNEIVKLSVSMTSYDFDVGAVVIRSNTAANLLVNPMLEHLKEIDWRNVPSKGRRYVVGLPDELIESPIRRSKNRVESQIRSPHMVMPLTPYPYPGPDEFDDFWSGKEGEYFRVLPYSDTGRYPVVSVNGMSGSPVFIVNRAGAKGYRVHLLGILRSEKKERRLVRIEPFAKVVKLFDGIDPTAS